MKGRRRDSTDSRVNAMQQAALGEVRPPPHVQVREADLPFWSDVVRARARENWTDIDLVHAANLARSLSDIQRLNTELDADGDTLTNAKGTDIANPRHALLETLSRRSIAISRFLQLAPRSTQPSRARQQRAREADAEASDALDTDNDRLIPRRSRFQ